MPSRSSLARLLQVACLAQLALALSWLAWRWPDSPGQALAGAALVMFVAPAVLAIEFLIVSRVNRRDAAPRPSAGQLLAAWFSETRHLFRTFYWRQPFRWREVPDHVDPACAGRTGVVLVHGFMCNRGFWNAWLRELRDRGHACVAVNLEPVYGSIADYAAIIDEAVARVARLTGRPPVLVCHSMGGLAARAWWRMAGAGQHVAHLVTIGSPHRGTWLARFSRKANGRQMQLDCQWVRQLALDERRRPLPPTTCWYSNCDNVVFPASVATLPQAENRFVAGQAHVALAFHPEVRKGFLNLLEGS
ncbi:MAG TPA: alpha/beta fold hydrolase [Ramlibacter sp.]